MAKYFFEDFLLPFVGFFEGELVELFGGLL